MLEGKEPSTNVPKKQEKNETFPEEFVEKLITSNNSRNSSRHSSPSRSRSNLSPSKASSLSASKHTYRTADHPSSASESPRSFDANLKSVSPRRRDLKSPSVPTSKTPKLAQLPHGHDLTRLFNSNNPGQKGVNPTYMSGKLFNAVDGSFEEIGKEPRAITLQGVTVEAQLQYVKKTLTKLPETCTRT